MSEIINVRVFSGIPVHDLSELDAIKYIHERLENSKKTILMFANSNFIVRCQNLVPRLNVEPVKIFNDGISIDTASKFLYGQTFKANLNGTDFTPKLLLSLNRTKRLLLLGAKPGVAKKAAKHIEAYLNCEVIATFDGFEDMKDSELLIRKINQFAPDIVLVGLGNPYQECWMLDNFEKLDAPLIAGVGALFDFMSNEVKRAPIWIRRIRMEWFYRLYQEPRRLLKRYTIDVVTFFYLCFKNK